MSRIDEALKRATDAVPENRGGKAAGEPHVRPADVATLDHYPRESRSSADPDVRIVHESPRPAALRPAAERPHLAVAAPAPAPAAPAEAAAIPQRVDPALAAKLVVGGGSSVMIEQYRRLAAVLHDAQVERGLKTVMVTSAIPREGKTLTIVNLALTLSESYDRKVLLIDADLRKPSVHTVLGVPNGAGLAEALASEGGPLPFVPVTPRLSVLPAGHPGPSPLAGLTSDRMRTLLDECEERFDWVLLDTPPIGVLPDAQLLARLTRAVVFVIGAGTTQFPIVERAIADVGRDSIIGTVLNGVEETVIPETHYYDYGEPADKKS